MLRRRADELAPDMILQRPSGFRAKVKSVSKASKSSLTVQTDAGRFVYRNSDEVEAEY